MTATVTMTRELEWFPFYAIRWLLSQQLRDSSLTEKGAYADLLAFQWRDGSVPSDTKSASRLIGAIEQHEQDAVARVLARFFSVTNDGRCKNEWLEQVRIEQLKKLDQRTEAAKHGAARRWRAHSDRIAKALPPHTECIAIAMQEVEEEREVDKEKTNTTAPKAPEFDLEALYKAFPNRKGKKPGLDKLRKLIKTREQYETVLAAAQQYARETIGREPQYVLHFSTWVNQQRWLDEQQDAKATSSGSAPSRPKYRNLDEILAEQEAIKNADDAA